MLQQPAAVGYPVLTCHEDILRTYGVTHPGDLSDADQDAYFGDVDACIDITLRNYCNEGDAEACEAVGVFMEVVEEHERVTQEYEDFDYWDAMYDAGVERAQDIIEDFPDLPDLAAGAKTVGIYAAVAVGGLALIGVVIYAATAGKTTRKATRKAA